MATICKDAVTLWQGRVLVLAHVKELIEQTADKLHAICPEVRLGVFSAGLKRRDRIEPVIVAGIQSIWKQACDFDPFDLIVDEAHLIPLEGDGMYRRFLSDAKQVNPYLRVIGFTATPFRLKSGPICSPDGFLNHICFEVGVRELIVQGYLCPLVSKAGINKIDFDRLHVRGGEFVAREVESLMDEDHLVEAACGEIVAYSRDRHSVLIFASGVRHGEHVVSVLREKHGLECGFVTGETPPGERDSTLSRFREGALKYLCNVNVLTTGFDAPRIDCVALVRPTLSPGLYYQMVGRGFRLHPSKRDCLVLDFGGNVLRHGPVDRLSVKSNVRGGPGIAPAKECPECHRLIATGFARCPDCGYAFPPPRKQNHDGEASRAAVLSGQVTVETLPVEDVLYSVHRKRGADEDAPRTLRVDYRVGRHRWQSEWVCLEHDGFARHQAVAWWKKRSNSPAPTSAEEAVARAKAECLAPTHSIRIRSVSGVEYDRVVGHELGDIPDLLESPIDEGDPCDFPFGANATREEEIPW
jgi:DNA repair protein RadD